MPGPRIANRSRTQPKQVLGVRLFDVGAYPATTTNRVSYTHRRHHRHHKRTWVFKATSARARENRLSRNESVPPCERKTAGYVAFRTWKPVSTLCCFLLAPWFTVSPLNNAIKTFLHAAVVAEESLTVRLYLWTDEKVSG